VNSIIPLSRLSQYMHRAAVGSVWLCEVSNQADQCMEFLCRAWPWSCWHSTKLV